MSHAVSLHVNWVQFRCQPDGAHGAATKSGGKASCIKNTLMRSADVREASDQTV